MHSLINCPHALALHVITETMFPWQMSEPPRLLPVTLPVTRQGTSKGHQEVNNKKENKEMNKKDDNNKVN